ncbi:MAG: DUF86 domain-containing protein [Planctomycetes bacterium]|nr:DUF86 domain-containing protein [Planctomycetota bacterium]
MNRALLAQKLAQIATCLEEMEPLLGTRLAEFRSTPGHFRLAERDVQLTVDSAVDVNNHLILEAGRQPPETYFDTFLALAQLGALSQALARKLARTTGLRNRIVHEYETVDLGVLHGALREFVRGYRQYIRAVRRRVGI